MQQETNITSTTIWNQKSIRAQVVVKRAIKMAFLCGLIAIGGGWAFGTATSVIASTSSSSNTPQNTSPATQPTGGGGSTSQLTMPVDHRLPIPPAREIRRAAAKLQSIFRRKFNMDTNLAEYNFYNDLYQHFVVKDHGKHHPVLRYAAMQLIVRLAPLQLDVPTTFATIVAMGHKYKIDRYRLMATATRQMLALGNMQESTAQTLLSDLAEYAPKAMESAHIRSADQMARVGITLAGVTSTPGPVKSLMKIVHKAHRALPLYGRYRRAERELENHPHDPSANTTVGLFLVCFTRHSNRADAHLLLSGDPKLIAIAQAQNTESTDYPPTGEQLIAMARNWMAISREHTIRRFRRPLRALAGEIAVNGLKSIDPDVLKALKNDHYRQAQRLLSDAEKLASDLNLAGYSDQIAAWKKDRKALATLRSHYRAAVAAMNGGKSSRKAFQAIGEYLCFVSGRWKHGLAYLRRSDIRKIRQASAEDAKMPTSPEIQKSLGDMWWMISDDYQGIERYNIRRRAVHWYNLAIKKLHGRDMAEVTYRKLSLKHETF